MIGLRLTGLTDLAAIGLGLAATLQGRGSVGLGVHRLDQRSVAQIRDLGVRHIRHTLYWSHWNDSAYRLQWERDLQRALQAGLDPLVVVHQPPFGDYEHRDLVYHAFARFMEERAAQFPGVRAWQLWNEMDDGFTDVFGAGHPEVSLRQRGHLYAQMLKLAYPAIKRGHTDALVVTGGIASPIDGGFLQGLYDSNAPYDVLAIHTYGYPLALAFDERGRSARRMMKANGDQRPLWNTEFGLERAVIPPSPGLLPAEVDRAQLEAWKSCIEANDRRPVYGRIYGHVLTEGNDLGFGLIRANGSARPAYRWLRAWMRNHGGA